MPLDDVRSAGAGRGIAPSMLDARSRPAPTPGKPTPARTAAFIW
ncbi:hypothetical protein ACTVCO_03440 [Sanguibacter sp. A247]